MRILESMEENSGETGGKVENGSNGGPLAKKPRLNEEIKDLEKEEASSLKGASLNLVHIDRYFYAPKSSTQKLSVLAQAAQGQNIRAICERSLDQAVNWRLNIRPVN